MSRAACTAPGAAAVVWRRSAARRTTTSRRSSTSCTRTACSGEGDALMTDDENALAGRLIERLLVDPVFRGEFRRDPVGACVAAGLPGLARELGVGVGSGMETLELRESRSSLAGVVMAAAGEGLSVAEAQAFVEHGAKGLRLGHGLKLPRGVRAPAGVRGVQGLEH